MSHCIMDVIRRLNANLKCLGCKQILGTSLLFPPFIFCCHAIINNDSWSLIVYSCYCMYSLRVTPGLLIAVTEKCWNCG